MKNNLLRCRSTWNPNMYHGWGRTRSYFEGWYFKLVDAAEHQVFAVIPGISMAKNGDSHAFIQVLDGKHCKASYHPFEAQYFVPSETGFHLQIGVNSSPATTSNSTCPNCKGALISNRPRPGQRCWAHRASWVGILLCRSCSAFMAW
ncbi:MAG: hypothetical protein IPM82_26045 [Saprospiraceae bacterium]|nr:hypothetical protein [Saprospiraceae bacterium]